MSRTSLPSRLIALGSAILAAATLLSAPAFAGGKGGSQPPPTNTCDVTAANKYAARAYSVNVNASVLGIPLNLGPLPDTGELPATGGTGEGTLMEVDGKGTLAVNSNVVTATGVLGLNATLLHNTTMGSGDTSTAFSEVLGLDLGVGGKLIVPDLLKVRVASLDGASVLSASSTVKCTNGVSATNASLTGSNIANISILVLGQPVIISADVLAQAGPNTKISLPSLGLNGLVYTLTGNSGITLNEQFTQNGRQVVNAVHVKLELLKLLDLSAVASVDVIISHAEAGITCGGGSNPNCNCKVKDFYTGGGQINVRDSSGAIVGKASIAVNGSASDSVGPKGHLNLVNHVTGQHITGTPLKDYRGDNVAPTTDRFLTFTCADDMGSPTLDCTAHVNDTAESGGGHDSFGLVYGAYNYPYALMARGNLQLHTPNCGTTTTTTPKPHRT